MSSLVMARDASQDCMLPLIANTLAAAVGARIHINSSFSLFFESAHFCSFALIDSIIAVRRRSLFACFIPSSELMTMQCPVTAAV
eukprot:scaffold109937_cov69-Attheya_sp.AAC.1